MAEPIDLGIILSVGELALKIPALFGMVETIDKKIDRLSKAEFESGYRFIDQAINSRNEQDFLLRQAWTHLNKAISLESELRLALSYLGLSFCQFHLNNSYCRGKCFTPKILHWIMLQKHSGVKPWKLAFA